MANNFMVSGLILPFVYIFWGCLFDFECAYRGPLLECFILLTFLLPFIALITVFKIKFQFVCFFSILCIRFKKKSKKKITLKNSLWHFYDY